MSPSRTLQGLALGLVVLLVLAAPALAGGFGSRTLRRGDHGSDVRTLQSDLTKLGFRTSADGAYGPATRSSVLSYERARHYRRDGIVIPREARAISQQVAKIKSQPRPSSSSGSGGYSFGQRTLRRGDRGKDVSALQGTLSDLGYPTSVDGDFGPGTQSSVQSYERGTGIKADGIVDPSEAHAMQDAQRRQASQATYHGHDTIFPVRGPHTYGDAANRFGAPRSGHTHQGQDVLLPYQYQSSGCLYRGKQVPLVAIQSGSVVYSGYQGAAGNYIVIHGFQSGLDYVYMHLRSPALYGTGARVPIGRTIGYMGRTGDATACHLHLEIWTRPGWYNGGHAIDPLSRLRRWDRYS